MTEGYKLYSQEKALGHSLGEIYQLLDYYSEQNISQISKGKYYFWKNVQKVIFWELEEHSSHSNFSQDSNISKE